MSMRTKMLTTLAFAFLAMLPAAAHGQSAGEIMRRAMDAQAARLAAVNDVTITQEVMGMDVGMYMEKRIIDGTPVLVPVSMIMGGRVTAVPQDETAVDWSNPFQQTWVERARLEGTDQVDGHRVRVLVMDDFTGLDMPGMPGEMGSADFRLRSMRLSLDDDHLIRKVEMDAQSVREDGSATPVEITMFMQDYREVDGYLHPFQTRTITKGVLGAVDVDQEELRAQLEEMKKQLASMPEAQRAMMERMMGPQMESLQAMLSSDEGEMEMSITVTDLKVNAGPPRGED
jgi:CBS domain-containing protein